MNSVLAQFDFALSEMGVASAKLSVKLHGFPTFYAYLCNTEERKKV